MKYVLLLSLALVGCSDSGEVMVISQEPKPVPINTAPASLEQCPTGGTVVSIGVTVIPVCNGSQGATGASGSDGASITGPAGQDGTSCSVQQLSTGALITCTDGTSAYVSNGATGPAGADAPPTAAITIVPLCGTATVYPIVFSEVGICLDNKIYGVYSENNGFMSYLPPGNYVSHGHNSDCSMTIGLNCGVTH